MSRASPARKPLPLMSRAVSSSPLYKPHPDPPLWADGGLNRWLAKKKHLLNDFPPISFIFHSVVPPGLIPNRDKFPWQSPIFQLWLHQYARPQERSYQVFFAPQTPCKCHQLPSRTRGHLVTHPRQRPVNIPWEDARCLGAGNSRPKSLKSLRLETCLYPT